jgi:hypothetical protein
LGIASTPYKDIQQISKVSPNSGTSLSKIKAAINTPTQVKNPITLKILLELRPPLFLINIVRQFKSRLLRFG